MAKTEVILTHNIVGLGGESDQVKVAAGYARNYLYPQGFAIPVSNANKRRLEVLRQRRAEREAHEFNTMSELSKSISKLIAIIHVKTGDDGKMFGSVTSGTIADALKTQFDIMLDKKKIHLDHPIKNLGEHDVELRLHPEVTTSMKVRVESDHPLPEPEKGPASPREEGRREHGRISEKRGRRFEPRGEAPRDEGKGKTEGKPRAEGKTKPEAKAKPEAKPKRVEKAEKE
jgi:large subunit ribosomal protein L9